MSGVKLFRREDQDFSYNADLSVNQEPYRAQWPGLTFQH